MLSIKRGISYIIHDRSQFYDSIVRGFLGWLPDKLYLSLRYRCLMGHWINWKHPKTFTEKLQWLKVYDYKPEYTQMVDKLAVKDYVAERIGKEHIIPTLGVWDRVEDIDWESLPNQFVLKTTHGGGGCGVVVCPDKNSLDKEKAIEKLSSSMRSNAGKSYREKPYLNVPRKIIAEKYMAEHTPHVDSDLVDYKFYCFGGVPKLIMVANGRSTGDKRFAYYDTQWNPVDIKWGAPRPDEEFPRPDNLEEMLKVASKLSAALVHARIDLYNIYSHVYFGEITFYDGSGFEKIDPESYDEYLGSLMKLSENNRGGVKCRVTASRIEYTSIYGYEELQDYKFFSFNGKVQFFKIDWGRFVEHHANYYSTSGELLPFGEKGLEPDPIHVEIMPDNLSEMIEIAENLSRGFKFLRVDLYNVKGKIYFGELTFYPAAGMGAFVPDEWDERLGELIII